MKVINIEAEVRLVVGNKAVTDFEKVHYVYKPTQSQQRTKFAALKDVATLVFKENMKGKFKLRINNNEGATYPSDWNSRQKGLRELVEIASDENTLRSDTHEITWSLEYRNIKAEEADTEAVSAA